MTNIVTKGKINRSDIEYWDGKAKTTSRKDSTGGTVSGLKFGDYVDVLQVYGGGVNRTYGTINDCINRIGTTDTVTLVFAPGTWVIDTNLTLGSNFTCKIAAGCVFEPASGVTLTFSGGVLIENATWTGGSGTVTVNGTITTVSDFHHTGDVTQEGYINYFSVTSSPNSFIATLSPALEAYVTGAEYHLRFTNANTSTTPTLNINGLGDRNILTYNGSVIRVGDITAGAQLTIRYDGTNMILLNPEQLTTTQTLTDGANISWDLRNEEIAQVTLAGNRTLDNPTNMVDGGVYLLEVIEDSSGSRTLTFGSAYRWPNGIVPTVAQGANEVSRFSFISDGTNMDGVMQPNFS